MAKSKPVAAPTPEQAQAIAREKDRKRSLHGALHHNWARRCHSLARMATTRPPTDEADAPILGMFVVTLVGLLDETERFFARAARARDPYDRQGGLAGGMVMRELRAAFTEDDLVYLEYRRHVECHPTQGGYELGFAGGRMLTRPSRLVGEKSRAELDASLSRTIKRIGPTNEYACVRTLAARALPFLGRVELATMHLHRRLEPVRVMARRAAMPADWWNAD